MRYSFHVGRIILVLVVLCVNAVCFADRIIYVDADAPGPIFDGLTWARAYTILQFALDEARSGDVIYVAEGTYKPYNFYGGDDTTPYRSFRLKNGVGLYGGFDPASGVYSMDQRNWKSHKTILSGDLGWSGFLGDNSYHVFYHPSTLVLNSTAILDGFIVSDGNAIGDATAGAQSVYGCDGSSAVLQVDINQGSFQPLPIAIPDFVGPTPTDVGIAQNIAGVVRADLERSGLFRPLDPKSYIEKIANIN